MNLSYVRSNQHVNITRKKKEPLMQPANKCHFAPRMENWRNDIKVIYDNEQILILTASWKEW